MLSLDLLIAPVVVVALALAIVWGLPRASAATRHWVLASAIVSALVGPLVGNFVPVWHLPVLTRVGTSPAPEAVAPAAGTSTGQPVRVRLDDAAEPVAAATVAPPRFTRQQVMVGIWTAGMMLGVTGLLVGLLRVWILAKNASPIESGPWHEEAGALARELTLASSPRLLLSDHSTMLIMWGALSPTILLPAGAGGWPIARIRIVLRHELSHIERGDWLLLMVAGLARAIYWFNPFMWLAYRGLHDESELACDERVLAQGVAPDCYATELLTVARMLRPRAWPWPAALAMARPLSLERRVTIMLASHRPQAAAPRRRLRLAVLALAVLLATALGGFRLSAQSFTTLTGTTSDQIGGIVPKVMLKLTSEDGARSYEVRSSDTGQFEFVGLPAGQYSLQAVAMGFRSTTATVKVSGRNVRQDFQLPLGTLQETITVVHRSSQPSAEPQPHSAPADKWQQAACETTGKSGVIRQPTKITDMRPRYPEGLAASNTGGVVELVAIIATDGTIKETRGKDPSANPDLVAAAETAVRQWRYTPTLLNCVPVEVEMSVLVKFSAE